MKKIMRSSVVCIALGAGCAVDSEIETTDESLDSGEETLDAPGTSLEPDAEMEVENERAKWLISTEPDEVRSLPADGDEDENPNIIASLEFQTGYVQFIDRAKALEQDGGGVAVVARGGFAAPVARLFEDEKATALEVFLLLAGEQAIVPERLFEDHEERSASVAAIPLRPRSFFAPDLLSAIVIDPEDAQCLPGSSFDFWKNGWKFWSSSYGNQISCAEVTTNFNITTWSSSSRALGVCYKQNICGSAGASVSFWGWTGSAWSFISSHSFGTNPVIGEAIYFGVSGEGVGQNQGRVTGVTSGCERIYAGVRSQISGGSDQC